MQAFGDHFIFKGGVTWDHTNFAMNIAAGGTSASPDDYGVDLTWYTGTSVPLLDTDRRGSPRPQTESWDVGSYQ